MKNTFILAKPWNTPFWCMLGVLLLHCIEQVIIYGYYLKAQPEYLSVISWFTFFLGPLLLLVQLIIYRLIRNRIQFRSWVGCHLAMSLFTFVLIKIFYAIASYFIIGYRPDYWESTMIWLQRFQYYGYWYGAFYQSDLFCYRYCSKLFNPQA